MGVLGVVAAVAVKPYRLVRIFGFFDPEYTTLDRFSWGAKVKAYLQQSSYNRDPGYHVRQSKIAVGSGGLTGLGLMQGKQKLLYLPEAHTDFIYAVVGEELGLVGCAALLALFLVILWRGLQLVRSGAGRIRALSRAGGHLDGGGAGAHEHERGIGPGADQGHSPADDQLRRQFAAEHAGVDGAAPERKRAGGMSTQRRHRDKSRALAGEAG